VWVPSPAGDCILTNSLFHHLDLDASHALLEAVVYSLVAAAVILSDRGLVDHHFGSSLIFLPIAAALIFGYAPGEGDAGTACCHRVQLLCFFPSSVRWG
jgi:hypothetical protein